MSLPETAIVVLIGLSESREPALVSRISDLADTF